MGNNPNCSQELPVSDESNAKLEDWNFLDDILPIQDLCNSDMAVTPSIISNAHCSFALAEDVIPCMPAHEIEWYSHNTIELEDNNCDSESVLIQGEQSNPKESVMTRRARGKRRRRSSGVSWSCVEKSALPGEEEVGVRICLHCLTEETPQWRRGPMGPNTLCNACGVKFRKGKLVPEYRPGKSPTFDPCLHSNSTKKLLKIRAAYAQDSCIE